MKTVLVTGSAGLVGSACVRHFASLGWKTRGVDNDGRAKYFGAGASTRENLKRLASDVPGFVNFGYDLRNGALVRAAVHQSKPDLIVHAAAQPSHDWAAGEPFVDFAVNAGGTLNLLEAARHLAPEAAFAFLSTNKVYGDRVSDLSYLESETRFHTPSFAPGVDPVEGVGERMSVDDATHSLFGCSKLAADLYVQEYGRYFGMKTVCFRAGCLTGGAHAGAEQHGFLAYLAKCCREGLPYAVYGHKGKQVRDQLHAFDVARACEEFAKAPRHGAVYNLGGGLDNSVSVLEAIAEVERRAGKKLEWAYRAAPRQGDHVWWVTDTRRFRQDYPGWSVTKSLSDIFDELCPKGG